MNKDILGSFFNRILPLFPPRTEAVLKGMTTSTLEDMNFRYIFTVDGMVTISHIIEEMINKNKGVADLHVSFQYFSRFADQEERYREVADHATGLWLYGVDDAPLPALPRLTAVNTKDTPLENYWFVIAYGPGVSATLLAEEITPDHRLDNEPRMYEGFYTFESDTGYQILMLMHQMFPNQVPLPVAPEKLRS
ncbi:MAG TPA: DICT sensory domain-containing protein [Anaerolineales bacterium]|nr:DICT sensory domain-containing protein [Anaerolineales bacterium]HNB39988.1 DICT sensory domain-containing protein [Anaerolineales bacterium]HND49092.1 DICT sensory domain-containing protein [Anaerolineales bacterium]HNE04208.1 DICT sensory domain-containing protein [Anaerolineales bacterium]